MIPNGAKRSKFVRTIALGGGVSYLITEGTDADTTGKPLEEGTLQRLEDDAMTVRRSTRDACKTRVRVFYV